jgi:hypothetical protein
MNLDLWNKVKQPPKSALKQIAGGRLKGMTDISPQWRYEALTENFGICGVGWKFEIDKVWTEPGEGEQVFAFANVSLFLKIDGEWSEAIPGNGGHKLVTLERGGLYNNDEAFKMAITDALSSCVKMLGFGADIYYGRFDGSKYDSEKQGTTQPQGKKWTPTELEKRLAGIKKKFEDAGAVNLFNENLEANYSSSIVKMVATQFADKGETIINGLAKVYKQEIG